MTVPIQPGPFSFVAELGKAGGNAFQYHEQHRQQLLQEAQTKAAHLLRLRQLGMIPPKDFDLPEIQAVFHAAGIIPPSSEPTPDEQKNEMMGRYITATGQPNIPLPSMTEMGQPGMMSPQSVKPTDLFTSEQRSLIGAPQPSAVSAERIKEGALAEGPQSERSAAVSGVPTTATAQAVGAGKQAKPWQQLADAAVDQALSGQQVTAENFVQTLIKARGIFNAQTAGEQVPDTERSLRDAYFASALQKRLDIQTEQATKQTAAQRKSAGSQDRILRDAQGQINGINQQIKTIQTAQTPVAQVMDLAGYAQRQSQIVDLQSQLGALQELTRNLNAQRVGGAGGTEPGPTARTASPKPIKTAADWDAAAKQIQATGMYNGQSVKGKKFSEVLGPKPRQ